MLESTRQHGQGAQQSAQAIVDQEVDLLEYLAELLHAKYRLMAVASAAALLAFAITFLMPNKYWSTAVVALNSYDQPGGVKPKEYRAGDTLSLLERDFVLETSAENERDRVLARMNSYNFIKSFIEKQQILNYIFQSEWDDKKNAWTEGFTPDMREAVKYFKQAMMSVEYDDKTGLLNIGFNVRNPELSARLANSLVVDFNIYSRKLIVDELNLRRSFLEAKLGETKNLEFQRSIYRMLETQLAVEALIHARKNFPLEEIQPAIPPLKKSSPKRTFSAGITFIVVTFLGVMYLTGKVLFRNTRKALSRYARQ